MSSSARLVAFGLVLAFCSLGCSDGLVYDPQTAVPGNNGVSNNGVSNNGPTNNGPTNNGVSNNGPTNNATTLEACEGLCDRMATECVDAFSAMGCPTAATTLLRPVCREACLDEDVRGELLRATDEACVDVASFALRLITTLRTACTPTCTDTCPVAASRCGEAANVETCVVSAQGCLDWTQTDVCAPEAHEVCVANVGVATCVPTCTDRCTADATRCTGDTGVERCVVADTGCLAWTQTDACDPTAHEVCLPDSADGFACAPTCVDACTEGLTRCGPNGDVEACATAADGCLAWSHVAQCDPTAHEVCVADDLGVATCEPTCADRCEGAATRCSDSGDVETCIIAADGCLDWTQTDACDPSAHELCLADDLGGFACMATCADVCAEGARQCADAETVQACATASTGCRAWITVEQCGAIPHEACVSDGADAAACTIICQDVCARGDFQCNAAGDIEVCGLDPNGCLGWLPRQSCDAAAGSACVDNGQSIACRTCTNTCDVVHGRACSADGAVVDVCSLGRSGCLERLVATTCDRTQDLLCVTDANGVPGCVAAGAGTCGEPFTLGDHFTLAGESFVADFSDTVAFTHPTCALEDDLTASELVFTVNLRAGQDLVLTETAGLDAVVRVERGGCSADGTCVLARPLSAATGPVTYSPWADGVYTVTVGSRLARPTQLAYALQVEVVGEVASGLYERFPDAVDLAGHSLHFAPDASRRGGFALSVTDGVTTFPEEPRTGGALSRELHLQDNEVQELHLAAIAGAPSIWYGPRRFTRLFVSADGFVSLAAPPDGPSADVEAFFVGPRIAALDTDLDPSVGGTVIVDVDVDHVVVTWEDVPRHDPTGQPGPNRLQIVLWVDGQIELNYVEVAADVAGANAFAGINDGDPLGAAAWPHPIDLVPPHPVVALPAPGGRALYFGEGVDASSPVWRRPDELCADQGGPATYHYDVLPYFNDTDTPQAIDVVAIWTGGGDGFVFLYADPFTPNDPGRLAGCLAGDDGEPAASQLNNVYVGPWERVWVVVTTAVPDSTLGSYQLNVVTRP